MPTYQTHCRWMIARDWPEVLAIEEAHCGLDGWPEEVLRRYLRQRNCIGMVAEQGEKIVGFYVYELHEKHLDIIRLAVHPDHLRQGVGCRMVMKLLEKLSHHRWQRIRAEVTEDNLPMQLFLRKLDFQAVRVLRGDDGEGDAYRFEYRLPVPAEDPMVEIAD